MKGIKINTHAESDEIIRNTINWLEKAVIGLNLCPFAKSVHVKQQIRYHVSRATDVETLARELIAELNFLANQDAQTVDTTLLIHPFVLTDFLEYNDFLSIADDIVAQCGLEGELQIASFHPDYQFADTPGNAIENHTNRSPYPILHILREASIDRAVDAFPDASDIYEKNMAILRGLGLAGWRALFEDTGKR